MDKIKLSLKLLVTCLLAITVGCSSHSNDRDSRNQFSIIILPDTQNAVDYNHQKAEGFAIDSSQIFMK